MTTEGRRLSSTVAVCVALGALWSCSGESRPNVIFVTVDTLRADHLGCYGYPRETSPFLDDLARRGVLFDNAFAASSTTVPSHATMFTGLHPSQHGARANGERISDGVVTAAQIVREAGYRTAAFVSTAAHFRPAGLDQGFDVFVDAESDPDDGDTVPARETIARAIAWLSGRNDERPLFLWVHLWDPHTPYAPDRLFEEPTLQETVEFQEYLIRERCAELEFFDDDPWKLMTVINSYDGEIRETDASIHELYRWFNGGSRRPTVWIVTSDHGEGLGNHRWLLHGRHLFREQLHVPLIVFSSSGGYSPARIGAPVGHRDLFPTVLDICRVDHAVDSEPAHGRSLVPLLTGEGPFRPQPVFSERRRYRRPPRANPAAESSPAAPAVAGSELYASRELRQAYMDELISTELAANFEAGSAYSLSDERYTLIHRTELDDFFFDRVEDPCERDNLAGMRSPAELRLRRELERALSSLDSTGVSATELDPEVLDRLQRLGYVP